MLTTEFDLDEYTEVIRMETKERALAEGMAEGLKEGKEEGLKEGMEKVQNYILDLMEQGLSREEIKKKIEEMPRKNRRQP